MTPSMFPDQNSGHYDLLWAADVAAAAALEGDSDVNASNGAAPASAGSPVSQLQT